MDRTGFQFSRRSLLRAAGSTLLVPSFLQHAFAQTPITRPNLVLLMQTNGTNQASFWPKGSTWDSPILNKLLTDPKVGPKTTLVKGTKLNLKGAPQGNGHDWGWHSLYSGVDNISKGAPAGGGPSVDQILAKNISFSQRFKTLHCGVNAADYRLINAGRASFPCVSEGLQVPCEIDIYALYAKLFGSLTPTPGDTGEVAAAAALRLRQRQSVLDAVAADLTALQGRLGPQERIKVDAHLTAVRDFERRLSTSLAEGPARAPECASMKPSKTGVPSTGQGNEANADTLNHLFMEFIANVVACNLVGVLTFQFGRGGEHFHFGWLKIPGMRADFHDDIAHKDNGSDATAASVMVEVNKYYAGLVADLGQRLASFPQAEGATALDNSLVVWGNELATGPHGTDGIPLAFVGGAAGRLKRTGYMVDVGSQVHQRLGCTIQNLMGMPSEGFGWVNNCGPFAGLELA